MTADRGYRAEIDGLRAMAVLPVVLFHAGVRGFSGGFVGVDVFFVISGFLITGILVRDLEAGHHSISGFYRRRILRILPALTVMLVVSTVAAWLLLLPTEMTRFAESLAGTALFASNVVFFWRTDYFNLGALSQPLLHCWSLAVEEQFYIVWPLLLAAIGAHRRMALRALACGVVGVSLAWSLWLLPRDPAAAFYLLPGRAWELALGAGLALAGSVRLSRPAAEALTAGGLVAIAACVKLYTKDTVFPGIAAVVPCLGAAAVLMAGAQAPVMARLLAWPPLRFVGLISYSLYLWHWPVLSFAETGLLLPRTPLMTAVLLVVMLALATLSWRFVERPFRHGTAWPIWKVLGGGAAAVAVVVVLGIATPAIMRALTPFTPADTAMASWLAFDGDAAFRRGTCFQVGRGGYDAMRCLRPDARVLIFGDSHAAQLWPGLARRRDVAQATATGCVAGLYQRPRNACEGLIGGVLRDWLPRHPQTRLILASRWQWRSIGGVEAMLRDPVVRAARPLLIGPLPQYDTGLPRLIVAARRRGDPGLIARHRDCEVFEIDRVLRATAARTGTDYLSLVDLFCTSGRCRTLAADGVPLQFDDSHLTPAGSALVAARLEPVLPR